MILVMKKERDKRRMGEEWRKGGEKRMGDEWGKGVRRGWVMNGGRG